MEAAVPRVKARRSKVTVRCLRARWVRRRSMTTYMRARPKAAPGRPREEVREAEAASSTAETRARVRRMVRVFGFGVFLNVF